MTRVLQARDVQYSGCNTLLGLGVEGWVLQEVAVSVWKGLCDSAYRAPQTASVRCFMRGLYALLKGDWA